ncbi:hypothetical protein ACH3XW_8065 [Acanthocheilonema viteae]|uniref:Uncharacterized protein n=1 Tax=Acanthocheilonema viteae TaxID=6277 RepID=A0A498SB55_ACAVI|nr:unnamed protein product [Acanthocheilonema viteae]
MFTLSVITTLSAVVIVDSLILYYPVYPNYVVPKHLRNFERNAPPRVFAKDPDIPSSGIVFLKKNLRKNLLNFEERSVESDVTESNNRQKIHSDRSDIRNQKLEVVSKAEAVNSKNTSVSPVLPVKSVQDDTLSSHQSKNVSTRFYTIYDSKTKEFVTSNEPKLLRQNENDNEIRSISRPYHEGTARLIGKSANKITDQLGTRFSIPFGSNQKVQRIFSKIPESTKISSRHTSGHRIFIVDSDAIIKPLKSFVLRH